MTTMWAAVLRGRGRLSVEEVKRPTPKADEVLLRVVGCGICGSDARAVFDADNLNHVTRIPGHEPAGIVAEAGSEVRKWRAGDAVALAADVHCGSCFYCRRELYNLCDDHEILGKHLNGALAEYMLLSQRVLANGIINSVPRGLALRDATLAEPMSSILASHDELNVQPGENVVVIGTGPIGVLHLILLRRRGARVAMVSRTPGRLELTKRFGPDALILFGHLDVAESVRVFTGQLGADVVICAAPSPEAMEQAPFLARRRGRIGVFAGLPKDRRCVPIDLNRVHYAEQRLIGNFSYHPRYHRDALALLVDGAVDCDALITSYPLASTLGALHHIRTGRVLKAVVEFAKN